MGGEEEERDELSRVTQMLRSSDLCVQQDNLKLDFVTEKPFHKEKEPKTMVSKAAAEVPLGFLINSWGHCGICSHLEGNVVTLASSTHAVGIKNKDCVKDLRKQEMGGGNVSSS